MICTTLVPGVPWPHSAPVEQVVVKMHRQAGPPAVTAPKIMEHLRCHGISSPTHMVAAGVAKNRQALHRVLRTLVDLDQIKEVPPAGAAMHHSAKYYALKEQA